MDIGNRKTLSVKKASEAVDVSMRTIQNWIQTGKVESVLTAGGRRRVFIDTLWCQPTANEFKGQKRKVK